MYYVLLSGYNNYYNRIYKRENTIQAYIDASSEYVIFQDGMNFEYRDGISTEKLFNTGEFTGEPNYLLLKQNATDTEPLSRWFVVEWVKVRGNQYRAILRRDLLADHYDEITESPCFIEKGYVGPEDSAIFNKEDMTVNQIKTRETLLKDESKTSWIVGYIAKDHTALTDKTFTYNPSVDLTISGNHTDWQYADLVDGNEHTTINPTSPNNNMRFVLRWLGSASEDRRTEFMFNSNSHSSYRVYPLQVSDYWETNLRSATDFIDSDWYSLLDWDICLDSVLADNPSWASKDDFDYLSSLVGKTIQFQDGVYTLSLTQDSDAYQDDWSYWASGQLYNYLYSVVNDNLIDGITSTYRYPVAYRLYIKKFRFKLTEVTNVQGTYKYSVPQTTRLLNDAPYKMFCIPYCKDGQYVFQVNDAQHRYTLDKDIMLTWSFNMATELGDNLYDLQILPYCPISNWRGNNNVPGIFSVGKTENVDYTTLLDSNNNVVGVCSWCDVSSKEQFLTYPIEIMDYKLENQCDMYRLCSPNYSSVFEFNAARNNGVEGYNVRYTYKPYQPFINVAPKFGRLYGKDFKDNRGLILSGDFSLPIVKDAWINYQLQNKNYQLAFDRQIENMEVNYGWQRAQGIANAIAGTVQGGTTGAMAGGMLGGGPGAIAGAVVGTGTALAGGIMDVTMQEAIHNEALDYARDNFGFQLGNIKALPNTLNKVSSIVANSKLFPFVEYYTCTDEEKKAFDDKLKYNGMTIGRIGHILDFKHPDAQTYVKGQIIRLEGEFDTHTANEIANEFMKGWYI